MSPSVSCSDALSKIGLGSAQSFQYYVWAIYHIYDAEDHWDLGQDHLAIEDIILALRDIRYSAVSSTYPWSPYNTTGAIHYFLDNCINGVDMSAILSAMLTADPDEIQQFIGITDAFMQSIWNRPYNREFFAALGRGFMEWP